jgi:hypothetical protein
MKWPFGKKNKLVALPPVELTEDERQECEAMLRSLTRSDDGSVAMIKEELADSFQRSIIALCLVGRAERFAILSMSEPASAEEACRAAAKACAVYPLSICFYDFACILQQVGRTAEAKTMFREFLRRYETESPDPIEEITLRRRDLAGAVRDAQEQIKE